MPARVPVPAAVVTDIDGGDCIATQRAERSPTATARDRGWDGRISYGLTTYRRPPDGSSYCRPGLGATVGDVTGDGRADPVTSAAGNTPDAASRCSRRPPLASPRRQTRSPVRNCSKDLTGDTHEDLVIAHNS